MIWRTTCLLAVALLPSAARLSSRGAVRGRGLALRQRGGSAAEPEPEADEAAVAAAAVDAVETTWLLEQLKRRTDRLAVLSRALHDRGLPFAAAEPHDAAAQRDTRVLPDFVVALSSAEEPLPCLIWGDAAEGTKVVKPRAAGDDQWCSLSALNDLRRRDPVKASSLWYDKYYVDLSFFANEAGARGMVLTHLLDSRAAIRTLVSSGLFVSWLLVLRKPLHFALVLILTSQLFWRQYQLWSPFAHAPLPLKLLIVRQLYVWAVMYYQKMERGLVRFLIEVESKPASALSARMR
ncbi:hypothetical protein M885DRAFT_505669 [Pelagophyceae sp. CCMP2097]|nr:hypothetical protein M885DRAFT_505669 [Pelagophyceae sp. CCMP2097]